MKMKNGLNRRTVIDGTIWEKITLNIYDADEKKLVFTGSQSEAAKFLGISNPGGLRYYIKNKARYHKKYAIRIAPDKDNC